MVNDDFNLDMDKYLRRVRKTRTDPVDYSHGEAKVTKTSEDNININDFGDEEVIVETRNRNGIKETILSIFKRPKKLEDLDVDDEVFDTTTDITSEEIDNIEEAEDFEEAEKETENFFAKLFSILRSKKYEDDFEEDFVEETKPAIDEDIKQTLKVLNHWLNYLPADKKSDFKNSEDFIKYKSFLDKYGLLKKEE